MKKVLLLLLLSFSFSFGEKVGIKEAVIRNLPENYKYIFTNFLIQNLENASKFENNQRYDVIIQPYLSWIGISYNICFDVFKNKRIVNMGCTTAISGEYLFESIKSFEKNFPFFRLKQIPQKQININLSTEFDIKNIKKIRITSQKGDVLVNYKDIKKTENHITGIIFKNIIVHLNTVILSNEQAGNLFQKLLNNFKIKDILLINQD